MPLESAITPKTEYSAGDRIIGSTLTVPKKHTRLKLYLTKTDADAWEADLTPDSVKMEIQISLDDGATWKKRLGATTDGGGADKHWEDGHDMPGPIIGTSLPPQKGLVARKLRAWVSNQKTITTEVKLETF